MNAVNPVINHNQENLVEGTIVQEQRLQFIEEFNQPNIPYQPQFEETQPRREIPQPKEEDKDQDKEENLSKNPRLPLKFIPIIVAVIGSIGIGIFYFYNTSVKTAEKNESSQTINQGKPLEALKKIENLSNNGDFAGCIIEAQKVSTE